MKKWKQRIATVLVLAMLVTLIPVGTVQAKSKSPAKLGAKDFVYTYGGKKTDAIKALKDYKENGGYVFQADIIDTKNVKKDGKFLKTNRNVKIGSTDSYVKKQYGKTATILLFLAIVFSLLSKSFVGLSSISIYIYYVAIGMTLFAGVMYGKNIVCKDF